MWKSLTLVITALGVALTAQGQSMSFFVSSTGSGMGGNLGGLAGADKHCQTLAAKAGAGYSAGLSSPRGTTPASPSLKSTSYRTSS